MEIEILKEKEVSLLDRKRINAMVTFDGGATPSIIEFKALVAKTLNVDKDLVAIKHVYQRYGFTKAKVIAHIYKTREQLLQLEKLKKGEKKAAEAAKKEVEEKAKVEAKKLEAKPEEKVEEAPKAEEVKEEKAEEAPKAEEVKEEKVEEAPKTEEVKEEKVEEGSNGEATSKE